MVKNDKYRHLKDEQIKIGTEEQSDENIEI